MSIWRDPDGALFHEECLPTNRADFVQVFDVDDDDTCADCEDVLIDVEEDEDDDEA